MAITLGNLNTLINDRRRDTTSSSIDINQEGFRAINSTLDLWQQMHDWPWTLKEQEITYHEGITRYDLNSDFKVPSDMYYKKGPRTAEFSFVSPNNFDTSTLKTRRFAAETKNQTEQLRLKAQGDKAQINTASHATLEGTWTAGGHISNVTTDTNEAFDLAASVNFDYSGTSGTLTNSNFTAVDISKYESRGAFYFNMFFPTITNFTSATLKIGSDASNYWTTTITTDYIGDTIATGWNKLKGTFDTAVGTPDATAIDYIQITLAYSSSTTDTDFRIENFFVSEDTPIILLYYSLNMVETSAGTATANFTSTASTSDTFLASGSWDYVKEPFIDSALELIFWMTGEQTDRAKSEQRIADVVGNLRKRLPSKRRYSELSFTITE